MEILEHELMDEQDAKEVAHELPESVSIRDLKTLLPPDFCDQVHLAVGALGVLSEHEWRSGPKLLVRFIMGPGESAQVQLGEKVNKSASDVASKLDEAVRGVVPAEHKDSVQVWHHPPTFDRWNEQWVFETLIAASDKVIEESVTAPAMPDGLSEDAASAWQVIVNVLQQENAFPSNGEKIIYLPEEWQQRDGERLGAELVVLHEIGDHCPYFNLNYQGHLMHAKMDLALRNAGFRMESQTNSHSAVYKALPDDEQISRVAQWADQQKQITEGEDEDFGDDDRDVFEPGGSRQERIQYLFTNAGLHIKSMIEIPADPGWGDLGKPKRTIESVLQPDPSRPWTMQGNPKMSEFLDFLTRMMSNLGEILETTDVDYTTKWNLELGAWEIKWFIGEPEIDRHKLRESEDEDFDNARDVEASSFQAGDLIRNPKSHWPDMVGRITHRGGYVYGEPENVMWWVEWGKNPSLDGPVATSDLELVERPEPFQESHEDDEDMDDAKEVGLTAPERTRMPSGLEGWQDYLQNVYGSFESFESYAEMYGLLDRLGFESAEEAWAANPLIRGSVNPEDFGLAEGQQGDEFEGEDQDTARDVWLQEPSPIHFTHTFKLNFDFGAGEGTKQLVFTVPTELLPPVGPDGDLTEIENFARQYARQSLPEIPRDDWNWLVSVEPANPKRLVSELGELGEDLNADVVAAAQETDKEPSDEQKEAGNYSKGHVSIQGLDISIENAKGSMRRGKDKDGKEWEVKLPAHYGYIKGTEGKDKDHIDVFIGENPESDKVYVVNQDKMEGGFDEHKVMLGFDDKGTAVQHYDDAYSDGLGKKLRGSVVYATMEEFQAWLKDGNHKEKFKEWEVELEEGIVAYHASPNKFKTFDTSKEGAHFGTHEQAANVRKHGLRKPQPYSLDIKNPLRLHDIGVWNNFNNLHGALSTGDHITQEQADAVWAAWNRSDAEGWEALKQAVEQNGYDGIVYQNEQEGPGDSYLVFRQGQISRVKEGKLAQEHKQHRGIIRAVANRQSVMQRFERMIGEDKAKRRLDKGLLVALEGDVKPLTDWLNEQDYSYLITRLTSITAELRYENIIVPALKNGMIVICEGEVPAQVKESVVKLEEAQREIEKRRGVELKESEHVLEFDDEALTAFFQYVDQRYFGDQGEWPDRLDYGRCTMCNSAPLAALTQAGHSAEIYGADGPAWTDTGLCKKYDLDGGHDFLVVDDRWLIDIWAKFYIQAPKAIYDMSNPEDRALVDELYPPRDQWEQNEDSGKWGAGSAEDWTNFKQQYKSNIPRGT